MEEPKKETPKWKGKWNGELNGDRRCTWCNSREGEYHSTWCPFHYRDGVNGATIPTYLNQA